MGLCQGSEGLPGVERKFSQFRHTDMIAPTNNINNKLIINIQGFNHKKSWTGFNSALDSGFNSALDSGSNTSSSLL